MYNNRCMKYPSNQHKPLYRGLEDDLPRKNWWFWGWMTMFDAWNPLWNPYPGAAWRSSTSWFITSWELGLRGLRIQKSVETTNWLKPPTQFSENGIFSPLRGYILRFDVYESLYSVPSGDNQEFANWKPLKPWKPWPRTSEKGCCVPNWKMLSFHREVLNHQRAHYKIYAVYISGIRKALFEWNTHCSFMFLCKDTLQWKKSVKKSLCERKCATKWLLQEPFTRVHLLKDKPLLYGYDQWMPMANIVPSPNRSILLKAVWSAQSSKFLLQIDSAAICSS